MNAKRYIALLLVMFLFLFAATGCDDDNWYSGDDEDSTGDPAPSQDSSTPGDDANEDSDTPTAQLPAVDIPVKQPVDEVLPHVHEWVTETEEVPVFTKVTKYAYSCGNCSASFPNEDDIKAHVLQHGAYSPSTVMLPTLSTTALECTACGFVGTEDEMTAHFSENPGIPAHDGYDENVVIDTVTESFLVTRFSCDTCGFSASDSAAVAAHIAAPGVTTSQEDIPAFGIMCICGQQFGGDWDAFGAHQDETGHDDYDQYENGTETITVSTCNCCKTELDLGQDVCSCIETASYSDTSYISAYTRDILGYKCKSCDLTCSAVTEMEEHLAENIGAPAHEESVSVVIEYPPTEVQGFSCDECDFFSSDEPEIRGHVSTHCAYTADTETIQIQSGTETKSTGKQYCTGCEETRDEPA